MIEIKITGDTPLEALATLAACGMHCAADENIYTYAMKILEAERAKDAAKAPRSDAATDKASPNKTVKTNEPHTESSKADALPKSQTSANLPQVSDPDKPPQKKPEPVADGPSASLTLEEIRMAGANAARAKGKPAVRAILQDMGVSSIPDLTPEQYPEFMKRLGDLNAE